MTTKKMNPVCLLLSLTIPAFLLLLTFTPYLFSQTTEAAGIIYVSKSSTGNNNGNDWANAYTNLQIALNSASTGDEIWVATGVYTAGSTISDSFSLKDGVALYGGFIATETMRAERNWEVNLTVLSGDIEGDDQANTNGVVTSTANITGSNSFHVVTGIGITTTAVLDGFFVTAGQASGNSYPTNSGGGLFTEKGSPTLANIKFIGNSAFFGGGVGNNENSHPTLTDVIFENNAAVRNGGGMENFDNCNPILTNVVFLNNTATSTDSHGGGMYNTKESNPSLTNVAFSNNSSGGFGGGIDNNDNSHATLNRSFFFSNQARFGGGANNSNSNPIFTNVTFAGNSATNDGGGMENDSSSPVLTNVIFSGNMAGNDGGAIDSYAGSNLKLINVTLSGNSATRRGGAMLNNDGSNPEIVNSIYWNNQDSSGTGTITATIANAEGSTPLISYSLIQASGSSNSWSSLAGNDGGNNLDADPLFLTVIDPALAPSTSGNLRLIENSPAINAGNSLSNTTALDLAGEPRTTNGAIDLGAYETKDKQSYIYLPVIQRP